MSAAARKAGRQLARTIDNHARETAQRAVDRTSNDIGEVVESNDAGRVKVFLPGVGIAITEADINFLVSAASLRVRDEVLMVAVRNEWVLVAKILT